MILEAFSKTSKGASPLTILKLEGGHGDNRYQAQTGRFHRVMGWGYSGMAEIYFFPPESFEKAGSALTGAGDRSLPSTVIVM